MHSILSRKNAFIFLLLCWSFDALSQACSNVLPVGYYVVIAAYKPSKHSYAHDYRFALSQDSLVLHCGKDPHRAYIYVYLNHYNRFRSAIDAMLKTRKTTPFYDAWVRVLKKPVSKDEIDPFQKKKTAFIDGVGDRQEIKGVDSTSIKREIPAKDAFQNDANSISVEEKITPLVAKKNGLRVVILGQRLDTLEIEKSIQIVDEKNHNILDTAGNRWLPSEVIEKFLNHTLTFKANILGYKPLQYNLPFPLTPHDTLQSFIAQKQSGYEITFRMEQYSSGDRYTLDHIYFYNDAAIMLPASQTQLNHLLGMMVAMPCCHIILHGHTNGRVFGRLLLAGVEGSFFSVRGSKKTMGSSTKLSKERARIIKKWLIIQGISENRISIKAWGGRKMHYDPYGKEARKNARVEMEFIAY